MKRRPPSSARPTTSSSAFSPARPTTSHSHAIGLASQMAHLQHQHQQQQQHAGGGPFAFTPGGYQIGEAEEYDEYADEESEDEDVFAFLPPSTAEQEAEAEAAAAAAHAHAHAHANAQSNANVNAQTLHQQMMYQPQMNTITSIPPPPPVPVPPPPIPMTMTTPTPTTIPLSIPASTITTIPINPPITHGHHPHAIPPTLHSPLSLSSSSSIPVSVPVPVSVVGPSPVSTTTGAVAPGKRFSTNNPYLAYSPPGGVDGAAVSNPSETAVPTPTSATFLISSSSSVQGTQAQAQGMTGTGIVYPNPYAPSSSSNTQTHPNPNLYTNTAILADPFSSSSSSSPLSSSSYPHHTHTQTTTTTTTTQIHRYPYPPPMSPPSPSTDSVPSTGVSGMLGVGGNGNGNMGDVYKLKRLDSMGRARASGVEVKEEREREREEEGKVVVVRDEEDEDEDEDEGKEEGVGAGAGEEVRVRFPGSKRTSVNVSVSRSRERERGDEGHGPTSPTSPTARNGNGNAKSTKSKPTSKSDPSSKTKKSGGGGAGRSSSKRASASASGGPSPPLPTPSANQPQHAMQMQQQQQQMQIRMRNANAQPYYAYAALANAGGYPYPSPSGGGGTGGGNRASATGVSTGVNVGVNAMSVISAGANGNANANAIGGTHTIGMERRSSASASASATAAGTVTAPVSRDGPAGGGGGYGYGDGDGDSIVKDPRALGMGLGVGMDGEGDVHRDRDRAQGGGGGGGGDEESLVDSLSMSVHSQGHPKRRASVAAPGAGAPRHPHQHTHRGHQYNKDTDHPTAYPYSYPYGSRKKKRDLEDEGEGEGEWDDDDDDDDGSSSKRSRSRSRRSGSRRSGSRSGYGDGESRDDGESRESREGDGDEGDGDGDGESREGSIKMEFDFDAIDEEDSPFPEVRASVSNIDDPDMPAMTIRMWFVGLLLCMLSGALNVFFNFRSPAPSIVPLALLLVSYPFGKFLAFTLPINTYRIPLPYLPRWLLPKYQPSFPPFRLFVNLLMPLTYPRAFEFSLNPGPWNIKEHASVFIMANVSTTSPYALNAIVVAEVFYDIHMGYWFALALVLATQLTGFGLAGLCRRFLVWPASMVWPQNLVACTLLNTLHAEDEDDGIGMYGMVGGPGSKGMSRYRFFVITTAIAFLFFFLPGYLFEALSVFSFICWAAPNNVPVNQLFGVHSGLGMSVLTFDWTQISWIGSPLMVPWWAEVHIFVGFVLFYWILTPVLYYTNSWNLAYFPIAANEPYDRFGNTYNVSRVLRLNDTFDEASYNAYSPLYLPATYAMTYLLAFSLCTCVIVHTALYHGKTLVNGFKKIRVEKDDIHAKLMRNYPEVPDWWFLIAVMVFFSLAVVAVEVWDTDVPVWALLLSISLPMVYILPSGFIYAMTGQGISLNILAQIIPGTLLPGKPLANMVFKAYSVQTLSAGTSFVQDLKLGHYVKVPPRTTFMVQMVATGLVAFVQVGVKEWIFTNVQDICQKDQPSQLTCPHNQVFYTASAVWGLIGPTRQFGTGSIYHPHLYAIAIGAVLPLPFFFWQRRYPKSWVRYVSTPVVLNGVSYIPPATGINYSSWFAVGFVFQYLIRKRNFAWWSKFNYVLSSALDSGTVISVMVIFFTLQYPKGGDIIVNWWGNSVHTETADWNRTPLLPIPQGGVVWKGFTPTVPTPTGT